ncbi:MAG TPA: hypothetical protein DGH14_06155 [Roseburia sp.]|jgi:hypothetical protein|nr:hypothetical protein [Roseburia sp.]
MSKSFQIEQIILKTLEDNNEHSAAELKNIILNHDKSLLENSNLFYVILNRMAMVKKTIAKNKYGTYERIDKIPEDIRKELDMCREKVKAAWEKCYDSIMEDYNLSYDMSEQHFREGKQIYELNKKILETIQSYDANSFMSTQKQ